MSAGCEPILLVDDEPLYLNSTAALLRNSGYDVVTAGSADKAMQLLQNQPVSLAMVDLNLPGNENMQLLRYLREQRPDTPVVVVTGHPSLPTAIAGLRLKIEDYLLKPVEYDILLETVRRVSLTPRPPALSAEEQQQGGLLSRSEAMQQVLDMARRVARTDVNILITGETGTGKEVLAQEIHRLSLRSSHSFQPIDCAAIPEGLLESTLFGHTRGAFTGAVGRRDGLLSQCHGGTGFLDEVGELPLTLQAKLLRTIQNEAFTPVGEDREVQIDTRFISATSRNLEQEMAEGRFRRDLYYRLAVIHLRLPPLRERLEDLTLIAADIFRRLRHCNERVVDFSNAAWQLLRQYHWPGNVREFRNVIERGMSLARGTLIDVCDLPAEITAAAKRGSVAIPTTPGSTITAAPAANRPASAVPDRQTAERDYFAQLLHTHSGNVTQAAKQAGLSRQGLHRLLRKHGLSPADFRR